MADRKEVVTVLMQLGATYRAEVTEAEATVWCRALASVDAQDLAPAADQWVKASKFMPRPADIIQLAGILCRRRQDDTRALPSSTAGPEEQRELNRRGMAMVRAQLRQGKLRVGKRLDDVLAEDE